MATTPSRASPYVTRDYTKTLNPSRISINPELRFSRSPRTTIKSEIKKTFENPNSNNQWSLDRLPLIQSSSSATPPMKAAAAGLDSGAKGSKKICLFYCNEMKELAERVASKSDAIELRSINWRTFEDGFPNLYICNAYGVQTRTGTVERIEEEGDVATAVTLARILSNIPISGGGPTSLVIFDIHALQERFYFHDSILPYFESGVPLLKKRLQQLPDSENISIAFPDDGAWKRFHKQLQHFPVIICTKVREGDQRFVRLKEGDPRGRHVVIVDDLVQSGGTLIECQKVLAAHGAAKISAYVTHGIFPNRTWERFQHDNGTGPENGMTYFWITDSCPLTVKQVNNKPPFEVLSLAGSIASALVI